LHYFLKVDGVAGDSTEKAHSGWFVVDGFDFGVDAPATTRGQATGKAQFSPLTVDIHSLPGLATLLGDEAGSPKPLYGLSRRRRKVPSPVAA
jgi:hypothetical protein